VLLLLAVALGLLGAAAPSALAHAVLLTSTPANQAVLPTPPSQVRLHFSEQVQLLRPSDLQVLSSTGASVAGGQGERDPADTHELVIPVEPSLAHGTYTVRWLVVSADSHVVTGFITFAVGPGPVGAPYLGAAFGGSGGPSETSAWAVSARFFELVGLGGLLGLIAFRWLVWRAAWRRPGAPTGREATAALAWGRDLFWVAFGALAVGSMLAEGYLLLTKSASALATSVWNALRDPGGISTVLGDTRFGSLVQLRGALLFGLFALGIWQFLTEYGSERSPRQATPAGRPVPAAIMAALVLSVLGGISAQGHASQAPLHLFSIADDLVHLASVSVWIAGLALTGLVLWKAPRVAPGSGPALAASVLSRFSQVALVAVGIAVTTGVLRAAAELSDPAQLWDTSYGRSIIYKVLLLCPIAFLALRNRRVVTALRTVPSPNGATLRMVRRNAQLELLLSLAVVVVAALLVAQVPGRV
jgi:copper transport protein